MYGEGNINISERRDTAHFFIFHLFPASIMPLSFGGKRKRRKENQSPEKIFLCVLPQPPLQNAKLGSSPYRLGASDMHFAGAPACGTHNGIFSGRQRTVIFLPSVRKNFHKSKMKLTRRGPNLK